MTEQEELAAEKLRREIADLKRPYLLRHPQVLTALLTSMGVLVGAWILAQENYFKVREERNRLQDFQTQRIAEEARRIEADAAQTKRDAETLAAEAKAREATAIESAKHAEQSLVEAQERLVKAQEQVTRATELELQARNRAEALAKQTEQAEIRPFVQQLEALLRESFPESTDIEATAALLFKDDYATARKEMLLNRLGTPSLDEARQTFLRFLLARSTGDPAWLTEILDRVSTAADAVDATREVANPLAPTSPFRSTRLKSLLDAVATLPITPKERTDFIPRLTAIAARHQKTASIAAPLLGAACDIAQAAPYWESGRARLAPWGHDREMFLNTISLARDVFLERSNHQERGEEETCLARHAPGAYVAATATIIANSRELYGENALSARIFQELGRAPGLLPSNQDAWKRWLDRNRDWVGTWMAPDLDALRRIPQMLDGALEWEAWPPQSPSVK
jgi:hypothetical protein